MYGISWAKLKSECPIDIYDLCKIARSMESEIENITTKYEEARKIMLTRGKLNIILQILISKMQSDEILKTKSDIITFYQFQQNVGRMTKRLDDLEEELEKRYSTLNHSNIMPYTAEIQSILYGNIYYILKEACKRKCKDKREFLYHLNELLTRSVGTTGAESRTKTKKSMSFEIPPSPLTAKQSLSTDVQKKLEGDFNKNFSDLENLNLNELKEAEDLMDGDIDEL